MRAIAAPAQLHQHDCTNMSVSVDAKLAAAAAAITNTLGNGAVAGGSTIQPQLQEAMAATAGAGAGLAGHHHHHHHHHAASNAQQLQQQQRSKKEDTLLLSLPSQDREAWYDQFPEGPDQDVMNAYDDGEGDYISANKTPYLSNRGHKLAAGAKFVRKGRLGGWENQEIFESRSPFPSNNNDSSASTFVTVGPASSLFERKLPGGFPITPSLTLVPSSSLAAGRPDSGLSSLPSPKHWPSSGSPTTPIASDTKLKKRKSRKAYSYGALASTSSASAGYTSAPIRAYLPIPPQNPIELVMSPLTTRTFSPRNRTLEKLSLSATELIEQDIPLVRALTRLTDFMRGNSIAGLDGTIGLPFSGGEEKLIQPTTMLNGHDKEEERISYNAKKPEKHPKDASVMVEKVLPKEAKNSDSTGSPAPVSVHGSGDLNGIPGDVDISGNHMQVDDPTNFISSDKPTSSRKRRRSGSMSMDYMSQRSPPGDSLSAGDAITKKDGAGHEEAVDKLIREEGEAEASGAAAVLMGGSAPHEATYEEGAPNVNMLKHSEGGKTGTEAFDDRPAKNEHNESISRTPSPASSGATDDPERPRESLVTTRLPQSVLRIANPQPYIESLFVSPGDLTVPLVAAHSGTAMAPPASSIVNISRPSPADVSGEDPLEPFSVMAKGYIRLTPTEQLETVRICLGELTRFLADSLEYQDRLSEIRDQVLGVERRRKGVWNMARGYAHQLLWEQDQEKSNGAN